MNKSKQNTEIIGEFSDASCILKLTEAEKRAREVIEAARNRKSAVMKKARYECMMEVEDFKKECEINFNKLQKNSANDHSTSASEIEKDLNTKCNDLKNLFKIHSSAALEMVLEVVAKVKAESHQNYKA
jgi:ATP synthase subunit G